MINEVNGQKRIRNAVKKGFMSVLPHVYIDKFVGKKTE
jgi:hypothetical protein